MKLDSSVSAIVTGGASGLGAATVRRLAAKGVKIAVFDLEHQKEKADALFQEIGGGVFCPCNVTSEEEVDAAFAKARAANGQERILVNCAGTGNAARTASRDRQTGEIKSFPTDRFNLIIQINLVGTFRCIAKSAAGMMSLPPQEDGDRGAIVNTASVAAEDGQIGQAAYTASKAGVVGLTLVVARAPQQVRDALGAQVPYPKRLGVPEEYASLAMEMIQNGYFNGEDVRLDGAIRMAPR